MLQLNRTRYYATVAAHCAIVRATGTNREPRARISTRQPRGSIDYFSDVMLCTHLDSLPKKLLVGTFVGSLIQYVSGLLGARGKFPFVRRCQMWDGPTTWEEIAGWSKAALRLPCTRAPVRPQPAARYPLRPTFSDGSVSVGNQLCTVRWDRPNDHLSG